MFATNYLVYAFLKNARIHFLIVNRALLLQLCARQWITHLEMVFELKVRFKGSDDYIKN